MTWTRTLATGAGEVSYRLSIEGLRYEFVTDSSMETTVSDRVRVVGLLRDGLRIEEKADIPRAKLDLGGMTARIADIAGKATLALSSFPTKRTYLTANLTSSGTAITVASNAGFAANDYVYMGTETMKVSSVGGSTTINVAAGRAMWSSLAQAHYTADGINLGFPELTDQPRTIEGRRVALYAYGEGDPPTGPGEQIWIGRCASGARLSDGVTWEIELDPITSVLKQDLGVDLNDPVQPRGIYYNWAAPLVIYLSESSTADIGGATASSAAVRIVGFYETSQAFIDALNTAIATAVAAFSGNVTYRARATSGGFRLEMAVGATARFPRAYGGSPVDIPTTDNFGDQYFSTTTPGVFAVPVETVAANATLVKEWSSSVPRGTFGRHAASRAYWADTSAATFPEDRVYLGGTYTPSASTTSVTVTWPEIGGLTRRVTAYDATSRWVAFSTYDNRPGTPQRFTLPYDADIGLPELKFARDIATGNVSDFIDALVAAAPDGMATGAFPDVRSTDFDVTDIAAVADASGLGDPERSQRSYYQSSAKKLDEVLSSELQVLGCYLILGATGLITIKRIAVPVRGDIVAKAIGSAQIRTGDAWPGWEEVAFGSINTVVRPTQYDPAEDRYKGRQIIIRNVGGFSANKSTRAIDIKPVFNSTRNDFATTSASAVKTADALFGLYGGPYAVLTIPVGLDSFAATLGTAVTVTSAHVPNEETGARGITTKPGLVVGRQFDLRTGSGSLTIVVGMGRVRGYTPAMRVTSAVGAGVSWAIDVSALTDAGTSRYLPDGTDETHYYAVGDAIRLWEWDAAAPTVRTGTIIAVGGGGMGVTLSSAWAGLGGAVYLIGYDVASASATSATQDDYAYLSGTDLRIDFATAQPAAQMGP